MDTRLCMAPGGFQYHPYFPVSWELTIFVSLELLAQNRLSDVFESNSFPMSSARQPKIAC